MSRIQKNNPEYDNITYDDILNCKKITDAEVDKEFDKLKKLKCDTNVRSFCGNKIIYNYVLENMLNTKRDVKGYKTLKEIFNDKDEKEKLINQCIKLNRRKNLDYIEAVDIYEGHRLMKGSINTFKSGTVKYLIKKFGATKMLDPTAGWGGRLLGARASNIDYIGIDTNVALKPVYDIMTAKFGGKMIFDDCLNVDFGDIDYDFVLTSPPYFNLEKYENMKLFESDEKYYTEFLIPLIHRLRENIKNDGRVCINISDYMYEKYLKFGGDTCFDKIDLLQQMGGKPNKELIYVW
jgi:hypothetical protein